MAVPREVWGMLGLGRVARGGKMLVVFFETKRRAGESNVTCLEGEDVTICNGHRLVCATSLQEEIGHVPIKGFRRWIAIVTGFILGMTLIHISETAKEPWCIPL